MSRKAARGVVAATVVLAVIGAAALWAQRGERSISIGGVDRTYRLYVPSNLPKERPVPLVFVFHGGFGTGAGIERFTGFDRLADRDGFIVAYPDGFRRNWYDGRDFAVSRLRRTQQVDDVAFVQRIIDAVSRDYRIDPRRVYATGISNGAMFSHYLAGHLADRLAAVAPVCGGIAEPYGPQFRLSQPVSMLLINGTADPLVPYEGGPVAHDQRGRVLSTDETVAKWRAATGSTGTGTREALPDRDPSDGCTAERCRWPKGPSGAEVELLRVVGGGHTWPGRAQYLPPRAIGRVCRDFDATAVIWDFFRTHPKAPSRGPAL